jgi:predicted ferric reductase
MAAVKFRGLDPRTGLARWGLVAVAIGITVGATAPAAARGLALVVDSNPQSLVWLFERLFAWLAYIALAGSVIYGLLLSTKLLDAIAHRPINFSLHQDLAAFGLGLAGIHGMLLALDHSVPFTFAQILVPGLAPHAPVAVAFGQVALYLMAAVTASFYLRKRIGQRAWRTFHYVTFLAFAGATIHGIASGSDSNAPWAEAIYLASAALVLFLLTYRIGVSMATRAEARDRAAADALPLGGGRSDSFPAAAQRAAAIADVRVGGSYLPVSDDAPGARPLGSSRPSPVRDGGQVRRNAMG